MENKICLQKFSVSSNILIILTIYCTLVCTLFGSDFVLLRAVSKCDGLSWIWFFFVTSFVWV